MRSYPLRWPVGVARTIRPEYSQFKEDWTHHKTYLEIQDELRKVGAGSVVISANLELTASGTPYARQPALSDHGVAVYFIRKNQEYCIACDKWRTVAHNLHAISLTIRAIRGIERWGTSAMIDAAFSGYLISLPAYTPPSPEMMAGGTMRVERTKTGWWTEMGFEKPPSDPTLLRQRFRVLAHSIHPDKGGDTEEFRKLQDALDRGLKAIGG